MQQIKRANPEINNVIKVKDGENHYHISEKSIYKQLGIGGTIRIRNKDYPFINTSLGKITHFNIQSTNHKVGTIYALPKVLKPGYYKNDNEEVLPILSFDEIIIGKCTGVKEFVKYEDLTQDNFKYSYENIQTIEELKSEILYRYSHSLPHLSSSEILDLGVAITELNIVDIKTLNI